MRVVVHEYANGQRFAYETTDDGGEYRATLDGKRLVGERICTFIETTCDGTETGYDRLLGALAWLTDEIKKRKASASRASSTPQEPASAKRA
jgi:hypothetical protein